MEKFDRVLFALDFSENSEHAFDYALSLAKNFNARLILIHVIQEPVDLSGFYVPHISFENLEKEIKDGAERMMEKFCAKMITDYSDYETAVVAGIPYQEILRKAGEEKRLSDSNGDARAKGYRSSAIRKQRRKGS